MLNMHDVLLTPMKRARVSFSQVTELISRCFSFFLALLTKLSGVSVAQLKPEGLCDSSMMHIRTEKESDNILPH